jgi:hypothetical protein
VLTRTRAITRQLGGDDEVTMSDREVVEVGDGVDGQVQGSALSERKATDRREHLQARKAPAQDCAHLRLSRCTRTADRFRIV